MEASGGSIRYRGGLRNWRGNVTWPFATLTADSEHIVLTSPLGGLTVTRLDEVFITPRDGLTSVGLRFYAEGASKGVTFWTGRRHELRRQLESLGWVVEDVPHPN